MERIISIGKKKVKLRASAAVLVIYKGQFGSDYTEDMASIDRSLERAFITGCRILWSMAKSADDNIPPPEVWIEELGEFDAEQVFLQTKKLFEESCGDINSDSSEYGEPLTAESLATSALVCKLSITDLNKMSVSMALSIMSEYCNLRSGEEKVRNATQEDFDNF